MFLVLVALILAPIIVAQIIREAGPAPFLGLLFLVALFAYFSRRKGLSRQPRVRAVRGAERTPILPHEEEQ
jgi:hypothetical protein